MDMGILEENDRNVLELDNGGFYNFGNILKPFNYTLQIKQDLLYKYQII